MQKIIKIKYHPDLAHFDQIYLVDRLADCDQSKNKIKNK